MCIFFYAYNKFPIVGKIVWKTNRPVIVQISELIEQLGENFEIVITRYFEYSKKYMKQRLRIPISLVEKHYNDVFFLVDVDYTYVQETIPRVKWLKPLPYEVNVDEASTTITTLLSEEIEKNAKHLVI